MNNTLSCSGRSLTCIYQAEKLANKAYFFSFFFFIVAVVVVVVFNVGNPHKIFMRVRGKNCQVSLTQWDT